MLNSVETSAAAPTLATDAVLVSGSKANLPVPPVEVHGYDFNEGVDHHKLLSSYAISGFQATDFGRAVAEVNRMIDKRLEPVPGAGGDAQTSLPNSSDRKKRNCTIFLAFTSNMISAGVRETLRYLVEHEMVDVLVTTAGGVEEDFIKCMAPTFVGDFHLRGKELREKGINRIGNLLVPNDNYCLFEDWLMPILDKMLEEQKSTGIVWSPSSMIHRLGKEINDPSSVYYWAYRNNIPVYSPALTDGSIGDMLYFHSYRNPGLVLDIIQDIRGINGRAVSAVNSGMIIVGGGVVKHHTCNANLMRNGADFSVYINTANEFDGSDSGARPDEAISWGKIKKDASPAKVYGDASLIFPLLVAETFARRHTEITGKPRQASSKTAADAMADT